MKAAIMAVSALIFMTGCNRQDKRAASAQTAVKDTASSIKEDARRTANDASASTAKAADKTKEETRKTGNEAKGTMAKIKDKVEEEGRNAKEALNGDHGKTPADVNLNAKIRRSLGNHKSIANEAGDVHISTNNGRVTLTGTVTSEEAKKEIARIAASMAGKSKVKDDLKVAERVGSHSD